MTPIADTGVIVALLAADACVVRMTELHERCKVWTVDRADFTTYRRHGRQTVACEFPPSA